MKQTQKWNKPTSGYSTKQIKRMNEIVKTNNSSKKSTSYLSLKDDFSVIFIGK